MVRAALLFAMLLTSTGWAQEPSDLEAYLEEIRSTGMSEMARSHISGVSAMRLGHTILEYREDASSGRYWPRYQSTTCPIPGADPEQVAAWQEDLDLVRRADLAVLQPLADGDGSGFVTTEEGTAFRFLVEFGYLADHLAEEGKISLDRLALAAGLERAEAEGRLWEYQMLAKRIRDAGLDGLPGAVTSE